MQFVILDEISAESDNLAEIFKFERLFFKNV